MAKKDNDINLNNTEKEFMNRFQKLCHTRQSWEVWADMVNMFARSYSNFPESVAVADPEQRSERWKKREKEYLHLIGKYPKDEQKLFPEMHALMVTELERRRGDFLGDMYMKLNLGSHWHGQFFITYCSTVSITEYARCTTRRGSNTKSGMSAPVTESS